MRRAISCLLAICLTVVLAGVLAGPLRAQDSGLTLEGLAEPSTVIRHQDEVVRFALGWFIEFESLEELFGHIDVQSGRWVFDSAEARREFADELLRRGLESRFISMQTELPRELLVTHTARELAAAVAALQTNRAGFVFQGEHWSLDVETYRDALLELQERWRSALNCWSASPSIPARVLSNWYLIEEGITLFGASYDSVEHFWQAVKYHPKTGLGDLAEVLGELHSISWADWLDELAGDQATYLEHGYAVEFLRHNLSPDRLAWFDAEVTRYGDRFDEPVRQLQERVPGDLRMTALEEKILWGDLADVFHLVHFFSQLDDGRFSRAEMGPVLAALSRHHFDGIYLRGYADGKMEFISPEFRQLMFEAWKVKFLEIERLRDVIRSTEGSRLLHFLNDGTSPDIPIPVYVEMLEEIRRLALQEPGGTATPFVSASGVDETRQQIGALPKNDHWWSVNGKTMAWNNKNLHRLYPTVNVYREGPVRELPYNLNPAIGEFQVDLPDGRQSFGEFLASDQSTTMGVVILHQGEIVFESYPRQEPYEMPIYWSVTKAFVSSVLAILEDRGLVDVSRPIDAYIPELASSSFAGVTVRNILDMAPGVACGEEYEPRDSCYMLYSASIGEAFWDESSPDNPYTYLAGLDVERFAEQGTSFMYSGTNTFLISWLVERLTGMPFQDALSREIWSKMGAEADGSILAPRFGVPITSGGLMARMRDVARFGLLFTPSYRVVSRERIMSERYIDLILNGGNPKLLENSPWGNIRDADVRHNVYQWDRVFTNNDVYKGGWAGQGLLTNPVEDWVAVWSGYYAEDGSEVSVLPMIRKILQSVYGDGTP